MKTKKAGINNLKVVNMVVTGKMPLTKKLSFIDVVKRSNWIWQIINEELCPILSTKFFKSKVHKKGETISINIWYTGAINIVGVKSLQEAKKYYQLTIDELKSLFPKCFETEVKP